MPQKIKILLVEDDPLIVHLYEEVFKRAGYQLETAFDGEAGLKKMAESKPDLVLSDIMMPKMNGLELLQKIKGDPNLKNIPVVLLTNLGKEGDTKRGIELGAVTYLVKSQYTPKEVVKKVEELISAYGHKEVPEVLTAVKDVESHKDHGGSGSQ